MAKSKFHVRNGARQSSLMVTTRSLDHTVISPAQRRWFWTEIKNYRDGAMYKGVKAPLDNLFLRWLCKYPKALPQYRESDDEDEKKYIAKCVKKVGGFPSVFGSFSHVECSGN